jgi:hypothetical protein
MSIESKLSGHWTDEEMIGYLYGVGPENGHLEHCADCQVRLSAMQTQRQTLESATADNDSVSFDLLAAQRRAIYQRLEQPVRWWSVAYVRRLAAGLAAAVVLSGSAYMYQQNRSMEMARERAEDAKLLQEVTAMASMDSGAQSTEPLQGLFE